MFKKFWRSEQGNYAVATAIAMVPLMAGVGGAVDFAVATREGANLQNALDTAALAIGSKYVAGMTEAEYQAIGYNYFQANLRLLVNPTTKVDHENGQTSARTGGFDASVSGTGASYMVRASASISYPGLIGALAWPLTRSATATISAGDPACLLALNQHASQALEFKGNTDVAVEGCVIASNSDASDSISRGGSAKLSAKCAVAVGGISGLSDSSTKLACPGPMPGQFPSFDPLSGIVPPPYGSCLSVKGLTMQPGTYCNKTISGTVTLEPGTYVFKGGKINLGGNGSLSGTGVTIFLMDGAELSMNANQSINLSPPDSGPYSGIVIYQARSNTTGLTINGGSNSSISGFVYAPGAQVTYNGNSDTASTACLRIVADTIKMNGNSKVKSDCNKELGGRTMYSGRYLTLVR